MVFVVSLYLKLESMLVISFHAHHKQTIMYVFRLFSFTNRTQFSFCNESERIYYVLLQAVYTARQFNIITYILYEFV